MRGEGICTVSGQIYRGKNYLNSMAHSFSQTVNPTLVTANVECETVILSQDEALHRLEA
jgi:hypothetical protein